MIWLPVTGFTLLLCFMIWIIFLANTGQPNMIFDLVNTLPLGDKLGHLALAGGLCALLTASLRYKTLGTGSLKVYWGGIIVLIMALAEEMSQYFIPGRTFDPGDIAADLLGIILAQWALSHLPQRIRNQQKNALIH